MSKKVLAVVAATFLGFGTAYAQETGGGAGRVEFGASPGGAVFFTESAKGNEPQFGNYALNASFTLNANRFVGIEGEVGGTIGLRQNLTFNRKAFTDQRTPSMWAYSGNVVLNPGGSDRAWVPYVTGGIGGLTLCPCGGVELLGISNYETYLTANVGGGLKWFSSRHVGLRGDYRFLAVQSKDTAPLFFGSENRYGHRVSAGLIFTY